MVSFTWSSLLATYEVSSLGWYWTDYVWTVQWCTKISISICDLNILTCPIPALWYCLFYDYWRFILCSPYCAVLGGPCNMFKPILPTFVADCLLLTSVGCLGYSMGSTYVGVFLMELFSSSRWGFITGPVLNRLCLNCPTMCKDFKKYLWSHYSNMSDTSSMI